MNEFWLWWQQLPANIDPVIFEIGSFRLQYYGLMYIVAFGITYFLAWYRLKYEDRFEISSDQLKDIMTYMILGLIIGARLAGGCPSGHGLSGLSQLAVSGFVALAFFFGGGWVTARLLYGKGGER